MKDFSVELTSLEELQKLAERVASMVRMGDWVWLEGDLGAGKTTLVREILRAWDIDGPIPSPTYLLMNEYEHPKWEQMIYHIDAFRMDAKASQEPAWDSAALDKSIVFVEWPEKSGLPKERFSFKISIDGPRADGTRLIRLISKPFS